MNDVLTLVYDYAPHSTKINLGSVNTEMYKHYKRYLIPINILEKVYEFADDERPNDTQKLTTRGALALVHHKLAHIHSNYRLQHPIYSRKLQDALLNRHTDIPRNVFEKCTLDLYKIYNDRYIFRLILSGTVDVTPELKRNRFNIALTHSLLSQKK